MNGFSKEMQAALHEDAAKLSAMTGEGHTVEFFSTEDDLAADLLLRLEERAASYDLSGPSAKHTADLLREAAAALVNRGNRP